MGNAYIVGAVRTPGGRKNGKLSQWHPTDLGALVLDEIVQRTGVNPEEIDDVIFRLCQPIWCAIREYSKKCSPCIVSS